MTILSRFFASSKVVFIEKVAQNLIPDVFCYVHWNLVLQVSHRNRPPVPIKKSPALGRRSSANILCGLSFLEISVEEEINILLNLSHYFFFSVRLSVAELDKK